MNKDKIFFFIFCYSSELDPKSKDLDPKSKDFALLANEKNSDKSFSRDHSIDII
jgi:hypothetical protein